MSAHTNANTHFGAGSPAHARGGDLWVSPEGEWRVAKVTWDPVVARADRHAPIAADTISASALKGSVFIAPRNPMAGFQNLGYIPEDERVKSWGNTFRDITLTTTFEGATPEAIALLTGTAIPQKKESTVIDKKNFEKYTYRTNANDLSGRHIGALVKVKTDQGVEITDVLTGIHVGQYPNGHRALEAGKVKITLQHYVHGWENNNGVAEVLLDGNSSVTVRHAIVEVSA